MVGKILLFGLYFMVLVWNVNNRFLSVLSRGGRMKVFIVMDTTENTGRESIIGVFESLEKAKIALADYVLNTEMTVYNLIMWI